MTSYKATLEEFQKARSDAYNRHMQRKFDALWELNPELIEDVISQKVIMALREAQGKAPCQLVTINFRHDVDMNDKKLFTALDKFLCKKWLGSYLFTWEFHTKSGLHPHIHLVTRATKAKTHIIRETFNTFKHWLKSAEKIDVKLKYNLDGVIKYITKNRKEDIVTRFKLGLRPSYGTLRGSSTLVQNSCLIPERVE